MASIADTTEADIENGKYVNIKTRLKNIDVVADQLILHETTYRATLDTKEKNIRRRLKKLKATIDFCFKKFENKTLSELYSRRKVLLKGSLSTAQSVEKLKDKIRQSSEKLENSFTEGKKVTEVPVLRGAEKDINQHTVNITRFQHKASTVNFSLVEDISAQDIYEAICKWWHIKEVTVQPAFSWNMLSGLENENRPESETSDERFLSPPGLDEQEAGREKVLVKCPDGTGLNEKKKMRRIRNTHLLKRRVYRNTTGKEVVCERIIDLKHRGECSPRYCLWIRDYLIVSFEDERNMKLFDAFTGRSLSIYTCKSQPCAMTVVDNLDFAVAHPYNNTVNILGIFKPHIKHIRASIPSPAVWAVTYNKRDKILLATSKETDHIKKYHLDGRSAGTIQLSNQEESVYNIACDSASGRIYVSYYTANKVVCVDMTGAKLFEYMPPTKSHPWTVAPCKNSDVCISYYMGNCIRQISKKGRFVTDIVSKKGVIDYPLGMCFNENRNKFALLCADKGHIQVFKF